MSFDQYEIPKKKVLPPCCPYCKKELNEFRENHVIFKFGALVHMFWCPNEECRALLSMQIVGPASMQAEPQVQVPPFSMPGEGDGN